MLLPMPKAPLTPLIPRPVERTLIFFFQTDCPTCRLITPYLVRLWKSGKRVIGVSQDGGQRLVQHMLQLDLLNFELFTDDGWSITRAYDPQTVPALYLVGSDGEIEESAVGF